MSPVLRTYRGAGTGPVALRIGHGLRTLSARCLPAIAPLLHLQVMEAGTIASKRECASQGHNSCCSADVRSYSAQMTALRCIRVADGYVSCDLSIAIEAKGFPWKGAHLCELWNLMPGIMPGGNPHMVHVFWRQKTCPLSRTGQFLWVSRCRTSIQKSRLALSCGLGCCLFTARH